MKQSSESLYNTIKKEEPIFNVKVHPVENQDNYYVKNEDRNCFLHSIYNINREMEWNFKRVPEDVENIILFGLGCGHYVDYISRNYKNLNKVIVVEPSLDIFKKLLEKKSLYDMLENIDTVTFIINKSIEDSTSIIIEMLEKNLKRKTSIVYNLSYKSLFEKYFNSVEEYLVQYIRNTMTNNATTENFKYKWIINTFRNLKKDNLLPIDEFKEEFQNKTAIMVSGGPSLEKNMHLLKKVYDKSVIFAVGSAIKILDSNGIVPHFRVTIDGSEGQLNIFKEIDTKVCPLIFSESSFYGISEIYKGKMFKIALKSDFMAKYIYDKSKIEYKEIEIGNSVANITLDIICKMKFKKIIFIGQDLCYSENRLYAKGSWTQEIIKIDEGQRTNFVEEKDIHGNLVYTTIPFLNIKKSIEMKIRDNKDKIFINATEGGLRIDGTVEKNMQDILESLESQKNYLRIDEFLNKIRLNNSDIKYAKKIGNGISIFGTELEQILEMNNCIVDRLRNINTEELQKDTLRDILEEVKKKEKYIKNNILYRKAIKPYVGKMLDIIEYSISSKDIGNTEDSKEQFKILVNRAIELREYLDLVNAMVEEFKGKRRLNIKYEE
ncbi:motility associated factor glycosyltransferase family protein [Andreesenia angusta]|uniref:motility associated factor glycosyltransferase family protein n=1 Tax=Andreesenia angusta TaxID=39480 RepID=UPI0014725AE8|nr:6-hydroxymethylpterin diphosphokinase MptE-like protein [Andreesenia angusta]